jgi:hypothetical protein
LETGQRADVLIKTNGRRIALEYQCAEIAGREWLRRHRLYRSAGICDLWILGADRMNRAGDGINPGEIGSTLLQFGAPLLFLDAEGARFPYGTIARFRPRGGKSRGFRAGRFVTRPILELPFPYNLLDWPHKAARGAPPPVTALSGPTGPGTIRGDFKLAQWLEARYHVKSDSLPPFFGLSVSGQEVFACNPRLWQAAIYYRFVENRCGQDWWLGEVETWVRRYVPLAIPSADLLRRALHGYQGILSAAGLLSMPQGKGNARVEADFHSLARIPDGEAAARLAAYRRTLLWERK